ncbi:MAG: sugar transporter [Gammaproteobacteria bacterium]|jgi:Na+/melibiose symporter-like transporter|nr:sugar transporter [Gammaproteobacteria bacterium]MBT4379881.1 sugar transporter [Gammaproteobacteria bacterium]MBT5196359.1 sugar transporter [Gammaproteobacteria bacterium]MBT6571535.1 sugar transporter [Gammaproteobacteria bacterium]MBT6667106.1 sugar transporter [Gammaproteobacteria bacterium]
MILPCSFRGVFLQPIQGSTPVTRKVDLSTKLYYGFGAVANGAKSNGFNYLLLFYYSQVIGLRADLVSLGILIALVFDAISDPLVGYISDNTHSKLGRRHPYMYAAGVPVALAYYFLWSPPAWDETGLFLYFVCMAVLIRTLITFYEIPATALVAELTDDYDQRTEMMSFRYFFGWWGGLTMAVMNYLVFLPEEKGGLEYVQGWSNYGLTASIVIFISIYVSAIGTHKHIPHLRKPPSSAPFSFTKTKKEIKETLSNRSFFALFVSALLQAVAAGVSTSLSIYFSRHFWELTTTQIGYMNLPYFFSAFIALMLAPRVSRWLGKKKGGMTVLGLAFAMAPMPYILRVLGLFPENGTDTLFWTLVVFNTVEVTLIIMSSSLIAAMIADVVEDSEVKTGRRSEGIFFAANSFAQKAVNGLGVVVAGQILAIIQFPTKAKPGQVPEETLFDLAYIYVPTLLFFYLFALAVLSVYKINREDHSENLRKLAEVDNARTLIP